MSESLRNDGRIWVPKQPGDKRAPGSIPESERDYYLERRYPSFGNLVPRDIASRAAKAECDAGNGVGESGRGVYLDFADAIQRLAKHTIVERYGNLFEMYELITGENPYEVPMRPASHYTMGGPYTISDYLATAKPHKVAADAPAAKEAVASATTITNKLLNGSGKRTVDSFHRELGQIVWDYCGMARNEAGLKEGTFPDSRAPRGVLEECPRARSQ